jgi:DNA-binding response OmpR family regulator
LWAFNSARVQMNVILETQPGNTVQSWREKSPDVVVFDLEIENSDTIDLIRALRDEAVIPILLLTPSRTDASLLRAYDAGVDECILKPISPPLFGAKIRAWLRQSSSVPIAILEPLRVEGFHLVPPNRTLNINGDAPLRLTNLEVRLLYSLMGRPGRTVTTEELCERAWGGDGDGNVTTLKNVVYRLRRKIEADPANPRYIRTVVGVGYQFAPKNYCEH